MRSPLVSLRQTEGRGALWHAVPPSRATRAALCGKRPQLDWVDAAAPPEIARPTCPRCDALLATLERVMAVAPQPYQLVPSPDRAAAHKRGAETRRLSTLAELGMISPAGEGWIPRALAALLVLALLCLAPACSTSSPTDVVPACLLGLVLAGLLAGLGALLVLRRRLALLLQQPWLTSVGQGCEPLSALGGYLERIRVATRQGADESVSVAQRMAEATESLGRFADAMRDLAQAHAAPLADVEVILRRRLEALERMRPLPALLLFVPLCATACSSSWSGDWLVALWSLTAALGLGLVATRLLGAPPQDPAPGPAPAAPPAVAPRRPRRRCHRLPLVDLARPAAGLSDGVPVPLPEPERTVPEPEETALDLQRWHEGLPFALQDTDPAPRICLALPEGADHTRPGFAAAAAVPAAARPAPPRMPVLREVAALLACSPILVADGDDELLAALPPPSKEVHHAA